MIRSNKQGKGNLTDKQKVEIKSKEDVNEYNFLVNVKRAMSHEPSRIFIEWIIKEAQPLANPFTNSGHTAFKLGEQNIGRKVVRAILESGYSIDASLLTNAIDTNKLQDLEDRLNVNTIPI